MSIRQLDLSSPPPLLDRIVMPQSWILTPVWRFWFERLPGILASIPNVLNAVVLEEQGASITATDFSGAVLPAGHYRVSYYLRVTRAASVSSSIAVTFAWTDGGVALSFAGAALTGNTTATYQQGTVLLRTDAAGAVTYATTYASVGATTMQYRLGVFIERVRA